MGSLYLSGLGAPQIFLNGQRVVIKRRKAIALLFYLTLEKQPQTREYLSGLLWAEYAQSKAYAYLRHTLWEIKNSLGESWLDVSREWIGVNPTMAEIRFDVNEFHDHIDATKKHPHPLTEPCDICIGELEKAITLYRGDFLAGFSLKDCPEFDNWQFLQAEILRREFKEALQILVKALEDHEQIDKAVTYVQAWLAADNFDERAHRKLMKLYASNGQLPTALRQFEVCRNILENELDLAPEPATLQLYEQLRESRTSSMPGGGIGRLILGEDESPSWLEKILSEPVQIATQSNLPAQVTPFIGRQSERAEIGALLHNPDCWLLTIAGMGGIGKTRLAVQIGYEQINAFPQGVYFVSLESLEFISGLIPLIAETVGLPIHPQSGSRLEQLNSFLQGKILLLILDNFDLFADHGDILQELHQEAPGVVFLVTSRTRLQITGEWVFDLQGLSYPEIHSTHLEELLNFDAVDLFIQLAQRTQKDFQADDDRSGGIVEIAQLLEGMPLGLVMAASWVNVLSPIEIAAEIRNGLDFLNANFQDIPPRQQSIRAVMASSWKRLSPKQQSFLAGLSIFRGGFTREAAVKIVGITLSDLKYAMDQSILQRRENDRFQFHELMRQYAWEQLCQSQPIYKSINDRHAAYYCAALPQWEKGLKGSEQIEALPLVRNEIENIQAAWVWVTMQKQIDQMNRALEGLCYFYLRIYRNREGMETCQLGLSTLEQGEADIERMVKIKLLTWSSIFSLNLDDHQKAAEYLDTAFSLLPDLEGSEQDIDPLKARLFLTKAIQENYIGNRSIAIEFYERTWEIYQRLEDLSTLSYLMLRAIDIGGVTSEKNLEFIAESINFKRKAGDLFNTAYMLHAYCLIVAYHFGDPDQAEALSEESCAIFERLGDPLSKEMTLVAVDPILTTNGHYDEQLVVREKKLAYAQERGDQQISGIYLAEVGESLCHLGEYAEAEKRFQEALILLEKGTPYQLAIRQCSFGELLLVQGRVDEAQTLFQKSVQGMQIREPWGVGKALAGLGMATYLLGDIEASWKIILQAIEKHLGMRTHYFSHFSAAACSLWLSQQKDAFLGIEIFNLLTRQRFVKDSQWFNDLYRKPICAAVENLDKEDILAAEERGKKGNLWHTLAQIIKSN